MLRKWLRLLSFQRLRLRREVKRLQAELHAERARNVLREDALLQRVLEMAALRPIPAHEQSPVATVPVKTLTDQEENEREMWGEFAEEAGLTKARGWRDWEAQR